MGCFGEGKCTQQRRARVSAVVDIVLAAIGIITSGTDLEKLVAIQDNSSNNQDVRNDATKTIYLICIVLTINVIKLLMGYKLWDGVRERNRKKCQWWLIFSVFLWILQLASFVVKLAIGAFVLMTTISTSLALLGRIFAMLNVYNFTKDLKEDQLLPDSFVEE